MGFHHYSHNHKWSTLSKKEQRTVIYVRDMVTGLTFKPRPVEFQRGSIGLQASVAMLHVTFIHYKLNSEILHTLYICCSFIFSLVYFSSFFDIFIKIY